jgi:hypothetical protein
LGRARRACDGPLIGRETIPMDAVFVLFVVIFAFGGIAAAFAWSEAQDRRLEQTRIIANRGGLN